jgi:hypothetical protein
VLPAERRADLVVHLEGPAGTGPVMGIVIETQRTRDDEKRRSWPLYVAALHARLSCPTCLLVMTPDEAIARWASRPITTLQPLSPFAPLVLGPSRMPRLSPERAREQPWLAVLSVLTHGNGADASSVIRAAAIALEALPGDAASLCYDVIYAALNEAARRLLEEEMRSGKYEYRSDFARHYFGEGRQLGHQEGRVEALRELVLSLVERHGSVTADQRERVAACADGELLRTLAVDLAGAADGQAAAALLARLPARAPDDPGSSS